MLAITQSVHAAGPCISLVLTLQPPQHSNNPNIHTTPENQLRWHLHCLSNLYYIVEDTIVQADTRGTSAEHMQISITFFISQYEILL